jgi:hypothetical protein
MATARKLTDEEVVRFTRGTGPVDLTAYTQALQEIDVGGWGAIELEPDDRVSAVKRRATMAAREQGKRLVWKRLRDNLLPFEVRAVEQPSPTPEPAPAPARRGRRRRQEG